MMSRKWTAAAIAIALLAMNGAAAEELQREEKAAPPANGDVDADAIAALEKMGRTLRGLGAFHVDSQASLELVLDSGQKIELDTEVAYQVKKPDKLFVELKGGRKDRKIYYDGHDFTVWAPTLNFYATVAEVDKNLSQLFIDAAKKYDIEIPLADLFYWGTDYAPVSSITSAFEVGPMTMNGDRVDQYAYSQGDVDWQLWISQATSLPRKVVITSHSDPSMPEFSAYLHWDTQTPIDDSVFKFVPAKGVARITFAQAAASRAGTTEKQP